MSDDRPRYRTVQVPFAAPHGTIGPQSVAELAQTLAEDEHIISVYPVAYQMPTNGIARPMHFPVVLEALIEVRKPDPHYHYHTEHHHYPVTTIRDYGPGEGQP